MVKIFLGRVSPPHDHPTAAAGPWAWVRSLPVGSCHSDLEEPATVSLDHACAQVELSLSDTVPLPGSGTTGSSASPRTPLPHTISPLSLGLLSWSHKPAWEVPLRSQRPLLGLRNLASVEDMHFTPANVSLLFTLLQRLKYYRPIWDTEVLSEINAASNSQAFNKV